MELYENEQKQETAVLVSVDTGEFDVDSSLLELAELTKTAGAEVIGEITQKREAPDSATYIGKGKLEELSEFCEMNQPDLIIVDGELSPSQQRNIENITDVRVIDRTTLILDIFAKNAWYFRNSLVRANYTDIKNSKYTFNFSPSTFMITDLPKVFERRSSIVAKDTFSLHIKSRLILTKFPSLEIDSSTDEK